MFAKTRQYLVADVTDIFLGAIFRNVARLVALVTPVSKIFIVLATQITCRASLAPLTIVNNNFTKLTKLLSPLIIISDMSLRLSYLFSSSRHSLAKCPYLSLILFTA